MNQCTHTRTKQKLVAFAIDYKGKHEQGFRTLLCCADCGIVIDKNEIKGAKLTIGLNDDINNRIKTRSRNRLKNPIKGISEQRYKSKPRV